MPLEIKAALVCDHVRREDTGKYILIGVYTAEVILNKKPGQFVPNFWIEMTPYAHDTTLELEMKVEAPGLDKPRVIYAASEVRREKSAILSFRVPIPEINEPGTLKLSVRRKGGRWRKIIALEVRFADSALPSG